MSTLKLVAATGQPLNRAGYLAPVFEKRNGECFEAGGAVFPSSELSELTEEGDCIRFEPVAPKGRGFRIRDLSWSGAETDRYGFSAYAFYFSKTAVDCLGGNETLERLASRYDAVRAMQIAEAGKGWEGHVFFLFSRERLVHGFIPDLIENCGNAIETELATRIHSRDRFPFQRLVEGERDDLAQLAQIMMDVTDQECLDTAIQYYGAMLLLSPLAKNFRVWLDLVLHGWDHPIRDVEYWKNLARGVYDAAEQQATMLLIHERVAEVPTLAGQVGRNSSRIASLENSVKQIKKGRVIISPGGAYSPVDYRFDNILLKPPSKRTTSDRSQNVGCSLESLGTTIEKNPKSGQFEYGL